MKMTGVLYVMEEAKKYGYLKDPDGWVNMGQGSPDINKLLDININIKPVYSDVNGLHELREMISSYYNDTYNINSKFNNINITNGGRLCLSKIFFMYKDKKFGCISPDYTAYYELFEYFDIDYIDINRSNSLYININDIIENLKKNKIEVLLFSNPKNPTGFYYNKEEMKLLVDYLNKNNIITIVDEVYSFFLYDINDMLSICNSIDNINNTNIIIINGLTKGWKLPGMRLCWILANENLVKDLGAITSYFDGGPCILTQAICLKKQYLDNVYIKNLNLEITKEYNKKRTFLIKELINLNFIIEKEPTSTFYIFASTNNLPHEIRDGHAFLQECLKEKVIIVPGCYFDLTKNSNRFTNYIRISYGQSFDKIKEGVLRIKKIIFKFQP